MNPQEKQKDSIQGISSEGDVVKLVLGYLSELGLSSENISVEHGTVTIHVFRNVKITIKGKSKSHASGRIDILVKNDTGEKLFVIESKKPNERIDLAEVQAISYARLLLAPFVVVTNLKETKLIDSITGKLLNQINESNYVQNGFQYNISDELRSQALQSFIGYTYENIIEFCKTQRDAGMEEIRGIKNKVNKKYLPDLFVNRENIQLRINQFMRSNDTVFLINGKAGVGKSNVMCHFANQYGKVYPTIFINGSMLSRTIEEEIMQYFNFNFSPQRTYPSIVKRLEMLCKQFNKPFIIFIDAIDECYIQGFPTIINEFLKQLRGRNFKVILSAKTYEVSRKFLFINDLPTVIQGSQMVECTEFSDDELAVALNKYRSKFELNEPFSVSILSLCKSPFVMRIIFETYYHTNEEIPQTITSKEILAKFLKKKMQKLDPDLHDSCKFLLQQIIKLMNEKHSSYVKLDDIYSHTSISLEPVMNFLRSHYILLDIEGKITFYLEQLRDYLYAIFLKDWDNISNDQFRNDLHESLSYEIGQSAIFWYRDNSSEERRQIIENLFQTRAADFLEFYNGMIEKYFRPIRPLFEPYTSSDASLYLMTLGEKIENIAAFTFLPKKEGQNRIMWKSCNPREIPKLEAALVKSGAATTFYHRYDFSAPHYLAQQLVSKQLEKIIKSRKLNENTNQILIQENFLLFLYRYHREVGLGDVNADFWINIFPLSIDRFLEYNIKYFKLWVMQLINEIKSVTVGDPQTINKYFELITLHQLFATQANHYLIEQKVKASMSRRLELFEFPWKSSYRQITIDIESLIKDLIFLRDHQYEIIDPLLSLIDADTGTSLPSGYFSVLPEEYSDEKLQIYIKKFFTSFIEAYRNLIRDNFSDQSLPFISSSLLNHSHIVIQYHRQSDNINFSYIIFPSDIDIVEVHKETDLHDIIEDRGDGFYIKTSKGEKMVKSYTTKTTITEIFGYAPIKNWCYNTFYDSSGTGFDKLVL